MDEEHWRKKNEAFFEVVQSEDGGYVAVGSSFSQDGDFTTTRQRANCVIVKFDPDGNKRWVRVLGSSGDDYFSSVTAGVDGGYVVAGYADKCNGDFAGGKYEANLLFVKYDEAGNCVWKEKGNDADDMRIECIRPSNDGGYIAAGVTVSEGNYNFYLSGVVTKFNQNGKRIWLKTYRISERNDFMAVVPSADGGYVVACRNQEDLYSSSDLSPFFEENEDNFIVKIPETATTFKTMPNKVYTGKAIRPKIVVRMGEKRLVRERDYSLKYRYNKDIGEAEVTITGKGGYRGKLISTFKIIPKKMVLTHLRAGKRQLTATWKKTSPAQQITNYEIRYRQVGEKRWKVREVPLEKTAYTIKELKKGKKYQVQICSYKNFYRYDDNNEIYGAYDRYYGAWSTMKTSGKIK